VPAEIGRARSVDPFRTTVRVSATATAVLIWLRPMVKTICFSWVP
jgi:hypothetical protein